jgi:hypothetical protein
MNARPRRELPPFAHAKGASGGEESVGPKFRGESGPPENHPDDAVEEVIPMQVVEEHGTAGHAPRLAEVTPDLGVIRQVMGHLGSDDHIDAGVTKREMGDGRGHVPSRGIQAERGVIQVEGNETPLPSSCCRPVAKLLPE